MGATAANGSPVAAGAGSASPRLQEASAAGEVAAVRVYLYVFGAGGGGGAKRMQTEMGCWAEVGIGSTLYHCRINAAPL